MTKNNPTHQTTKLSAFFLFLLIMAPLNAEENSDESTIHDLTEQWTAAWNIGTGEFNAELFRTLFASGENELEVFDNVQGDVIVLRSIDEYIKAWKPFMEPLQSWSIEMSDLQIRVSGDLAATTFRLDGTDTRGPQGEEIPFGQYGTHVWKRYPTQGWRIVHEHLTSYDRREVATKSEFTSIRSIDHVSISTNNRSLVDWYCEVLDFKIEDQWIAPEVVPGFQLMYLVHPSGTRLEIAVGDPVISQAVVPTSIPEDFAKAGFRHLCFAVENVDEIIEVARLRGANVVAEPFDFPYLKKRLGFIQDPDGNAIEFVQPMK